MTRRSKRVLIVTAILVAVVAGFRWWTKPCRDPRLVGKWVYEPIPSVVCTFEANGALDRFEWNSSENSSSGQGELSWEVQGNQLLMAKAAPPISETKEWLKFLANKCRGYEPISPIRLEIVELNERLLKVRPAEGANVVTTYNRLDN